MAEAVEDCAGVSTCLVILADALVPQVEGPGKAHYPGTCIGASGRGSKESPPPSERGNKLPKKQTRVDVQEKPWWWGEGPEGA